MIIHTGRRTRGRGIEKSFVQVRNKQLYEKNYPRLRVYDLSQNGATRFGRGNTRESSLSTLTRNSGAFYDKVRRGWLCFRSFVLW